MWSFRPTTDAVARTAEALDRVFTECLAKLDEFGVLGLRAHLQVSQAVKVVSDEAVDFNTYAWRDARVDGFAFWVDLKAVPWSLHAVYDGGAGTVSFIGVMLTAGPKESSDAENTKAVSVENLVTAKATRAARQLAQRLVSQYGYFDLTRLFAGFGR